MTLKSSLLLLFFALFSMSLCAQHILVLDKGGRIKRLRYRPGDTLLVKLHSGEKVRNMITRIDSGSFTLGARKISVEDVKKVYKRRYFFDKYWPYAIQGGLYYAGFYVLNTYLFGTGHPFTNPGFYIPTASLFVAAGIMNWLSHRRYRIGRCCNLKTLNLGNLEPPRKQFKHETDEEYQHYLENRGTW